MASMSNGRVARRLKISTAWYHLFQYLNDLQYQSSFVRALVGYLHAFVYYGALLNQRDVRVLTNALIGLFWDVLLRRLTVPILIWFS